MRELALLCLAIFIASCSATRKFNTVKVESQFVSKIVSPTFVYSSIEKFASLTPADSSQIQKSETHVLSGFADQQKLIAKKPAIPRERFDKSKLGKALKITGGVVMAGGFAVFLLGHKKSGQTGTLTWKNLSKLIASTSLMMTGLIIIGAGLLLLLIGVIIYRRNTYRTKGNGPLY